MKLVIQRVSKASVSVKGIEASSIKKGLFILVGITASDTEEIVRQLVEKVSKIRLMSDENEKMNLTVTDAGGEFLVVSQFTLYGNTKGGNRPSFIDAARPEIARPLYDLFVSELQSKGFEVKTGRFGEYMDIHAQLDGPVTILIES